MRLRPTVTPTVGALCPFGKARVTSPAIDNASAFGKFADVRLWHIPEEAVSSGKVRSLGMTGRAENVPLPPNLTHSGLLYVAMSTLLTRKSEKTAATKKQRELRGRMAPQGVALPAYRLCLGRLRLPDFHLARLRHQVQAQHQAYRRDGDRVDQSISDTTGRRIRRRGDEWHQPATPAVADHIRHGYRRVADPAGEIFGQERADRPVDHPDIGDQNGDDEDRDRIVDTARMRDRSEPQIERIVGDRRKEEAPQYHRFAADDVRQPAEQDECRGPDDQPGSPDIGGGQRVHLGNRLQEVQRPELAAVPDHALAQYDNGRDHHELEIGAEERLLPGILARPALGLDLLVDRRLLEAEPHVEGD